MFVIFGWVKEAAPVRPLLTCYCYHCQKQASWDLWRETEWVSFFYIKTIPFLWKDYLVCSGCKDVVYLDDKRSRQVRDGKPMPELEGFLEEHQLSGKNEVQRNFLLTQRAGRENGGKREGR